MKKEISISVTLTMILVLPFFRMSGSNFNLFNYCAEKCEQPLPVFEEAFPWDNYITGTDLASPAVFSRNHQIFTHFDRDAQFMMMRIYQEYLTLQPVVLEDSSDLNYKLEMGRDFLNASTDTLPAVTSDLHIMGDIVLETILVSVNKGISSGDFDHQSPLGATVLEKLREQNYYPKVPISDWQKLWKYMQEGRWGYIWSVFKARFLKDSLWGSLLGLSLLLNLRLYLKVRKRKKRSATGFPFAANSASSPDTLIQ